MRKIFLSKSLISGCLLFLVSAVSGTPGVQYPTSKGQREVQYEVVQQQKNLVTLHGRVVDARTGEPLAKVKVIAQGTDQNATTDEKGAFTIENLPAGRLDLYITTVSFGLVKKSIVLKDGENPETMIALNEDAAALTEKVSIAIEPYEGTETNVASEQLLNKRELQALSSMLLSDPVRAAQALPGATSDDDFRSEFAIRGAAFERVGLYLDGVLTDNFVHTVQGGYLDVGSLSVINADTVSTMSLLSAGFPAKYGDRTAAVLDVTTRDGNRIKPAGRLAASLSGLAGVIDGPFAKARGSYLFAARKSYVGYLIRRINDKNHFTNNPPILNFADLQGKALYDPTKRNQIGFSFIYGGFNFDRNRDRDFLSTNTVFRANSHSLLANGQWSFTPNTRTFWQTRVFGFRTSFRNTNRNDSALEDGVRTQYGARSDINFQARPSHRIEAGVYVRSLGVDSLAQRFFSSGDLFNAISLNKKTAEQSFYAQDTWTGERQRLSLTGGARVEHSGATRQTLFAPRVALGWSARKEWKLRLAAGRYYQFPTLEQMFGLLGNPLLRAEESTHYNASVERRFGDRMRVLAELYDREDANLFFSLSEPRLFGTVVGFTEFPFRNSLHGHARGLELTFQRRSANKLAGWVSYAYSRTRLTDRGTDLRFVSDVDQRHTLNVYGGYRFTETWDLNGQWRLGSGQPVPGFYSRFGTEYFLANERNLTRVPYYSRVDLRMSKAFLFDRWKLTVTGEVINLLNRNNVRFAGFDGFASDGRVFGRLDRLLPILPSVGVVVEF